MATTIVGTVAGACTYVATSDLKTYLGISATTDDALLALLLARAQQYIETYTGRRFDAHTETHSFGEADIWVESGYQSNRAWTNTSAIATIAGRKLRLDDDLLTVTTLTNGDGTVITSGSYILEPQNTTPKRFIRLHTDYEWEFDVDTFVTVAGTWGYSSTPPYDIQHACLRLAGYYYRQKDAQVFDVTASPELGIITVPAGFPKDVKTILDAYRMVLL